MTTDEEKAKISVGCATLFFAIPASVIWWVLFGMMLHKTGAGAMEWSLYVGYLVMSAITLAGSSIWRVVFEK